MLLAGLWPLDFRPVNNVWWLSDNGGLHFEGPNGSSKDNAGGIVFTPDPLTHPDTSLFKKGEISIELWLRPAIEQHNGVPKIVTFYDAHNSEKLIIGQWKSYILARLAPPDYRNKKPFREIGARTAMLAGQVNFVTLTSSKDGSSIYLNGEPDRRSKDFRLLADSETLAGYRSYLGNALDIAGPWSGDIFGFAIYGKALTEAEVQQSYRQWTQYSELTSNDHNGVIARYEFNGESGLRISNTAGPFNPLFVPEHLVFSQKALAKPDIYRNNVKDVILNIVGFIPFGVVFALLSSKVLNWPPGRACLVTILAGVLISLFIEVVQAYLPTRHSSQSDLICNALGTVIGAAVFYFIAKFRMDSVFIKK